MSKPVFEMFFTIGQNYALKIDRRETAVSKYKESLVDISAKDSRTFYEELEKSEQLRTFLEVNKINDYPLNGSFEYEVEYICLIINIQSFCAKSANPLPSPAFDGGVDQADAIRQRLWLEFKFEFKNIAETNASFDKFASSL